MRPAYGLDPGRIARQQSSAMPIDTNSSVMEKLYGAHFTNCFHAQIANLSERPYMKNISQ
jgi:hypothetical protein